MSYLYTNPTVWAETYRARNASPPTDPNAIIDWIHLQHFPSVYEHRIEAELVRLMRGHRKTSARFLAIDAEGGTGKSAAITSIMLRDAMESPGVAWLNRDAGSGRLHIPWVYVLATSTGTNVKIMQEIARFCGLPDKGDEATLRKRLASQLPLLGVKAVVVDEAQTMKRRTASASRVTDGLRALMHLPVPFVWVGLDLNSSALLQDYGNRHDTVHQIRRRTARVTLEPLKGPGGAAEFRRLVVEFGRRMQQIDQFNAKGLAQSDLLKQMAVGCDLRPGLLFEALKRAACAAMDEDRRLTGDQVLAELSMGH